MNTSNWSCDSIRVHAGDTGVWLRVHARARRRNRKPRSSRITPKQYAPSLFFFASPSCFVPEDTTPEWTHVWPTHAEYTQAIFYLSADARYLEKQREFAWCSYSTYRCVSSLNVQRMALAADGRAPFRVCFVLCLESSYHRRSIFLLIYFWRCGNFVWMLMKWFCLFLITFGNLVDRLLRRKWSYSIDEYWCLINSKPTMGLSLFNKRSFVIHKTRFWLVF